MAECFKKLGTEITKSVWVLPKYSLEHNHKTTWQGTTKTFLGGLLPYKAGYMVTPVVCWLEGA